jgi:hypothetical protein
MIGANHGHPLLDLLRNPTRQSIRMTGWLELPRRHGFLKESPADSGPFSGRLPYAAVRGIIAMLTHREPAGATGVIPDAGPAALTGLA